jgi:hypothetical protein
MNPGNSAGQHIELDAASGRVRARTLLGDFELTVCTDGTYKLDGGAMFGVVPKPLWEKRAAADDQNRILLGLNTVVVRTGKQTVLIISGRFRRSGWFCLRTTMRGRWLVLG